MFEWKLKTCVHFAVSQTEIQEWLVKLSSHVVRVLRTFIVVKTGHFNPPSFVSFFLSGLTTKTTTSLHDTFRKLTSNNICQRNAQRLFCPRKIGAKRKCEQMFGGKGASRNFASSSTLCQAIITNTLVLCVQRLVETNGDS